MVSKIDQCMLDLMRFHGEGEEAGSDDSTDGTSIQAAAPSATVTTSPPLKTANLSKKLTSEPQLSNGDPAGVLADGGVQQPTAKQRRVDEGRFL